MVHGSYPIQDVEVSKPARKDNSFKSCVISMFIVFLLCIIIILILWRTKSDSGGSYKPIEDTTKLTETQLDARVGSPPSFPVFTTTIQDDVKTDIIPSITTAKGTGIKGYQNITTTDSTSVTQLLKSNDTATTDSTSVTQRVKSIDTATTDLTSVTQVVKSIDTATTNSTSVKQLLKSIDAATTDSTSVTQQVKSIDTATTGSTSVTQQVKSIDVATTDSTSVTQLVKSIDTATTDSTSVKQLLKSIDAATTDSTSVTQLVKSINTATTDSTSITQLVKSIDTATTDSTSVTQLAKSIDTATTDSITVTQLVNIGTSLDETTLDDLSFSSKSTLTDTSDISSTLTSDISGHTTFIVENLTEIAPINLTTNSIETSSDTTLDITEKTSLVVSKSQITQSTITTPVPMLITLKNNDTCQTSECKVVASRMLSLMNHKVHPCDNFYEFACGGLRENDALLQEDPAQDVWTRIASAVGKINRSSNLAYQEFLHFYDKCVEYEHTVNESVRLELAQKLVSDVGDMYNISELEEADTTFNFTNLLIELFKLDSAPLFDISIDVNPQTTTNFQLKLTVPRSHSKLQLESPSFSRCKSHIKSDDPHSIDMKSIYENKYITCIRNYSEYNTILKTAVTYLGLFDETDAEVVKEHIGNITSFINSDIFLSFEEIDPWRIRVNTLEKKFTTTTVGDLETQYGEVEWEILFGALFSTMKVDKNTEVQVYFKNYFEKLFGRLKNKLSESTGKAIVHNGLLAMLTYDIYVDLIKPRPCDREEYCLKISSGLMKYESSFLYLSTFTSEELTNKKDTLIKLSKELNNVLNEEIDEISWLDQEARHNVLDKLSNMKVITHVSESTLFDPDNLNSSFINNLNFTNNHFQNAVELLRQYRKTYLDIGLNTSAPRAILFFSLPSDTHPVSVYALNTVILPIGMIGSWKYTNELPSFVWNARIGIEIARQIVHHFDTIGIKYNAAGSDTKFLEGNANDTYVTTYVSCEEQFQDNTFNWTSQRNQTYTYKVNAARTMNEHFTDNSALWLTYKLYNKTVASENVLPWLGMSHDELYLLLAAQEFCAKSELLDYTITMFETEHFAPHIRVNNMIEDSAMFANMYKNCQPHTTNNSGWKCAPFPKANEI